MLNNDIEKEVGLLLAALKLVKAMVNHSVLSVEDDAEEQCIRPQTGESAALFNILAVDFISPLGDPFPDRTTMLDGLREICQTPNFDVGSSVAPLARAVEELANWLDFEATFKEILLPSIDRELTLVMARKEFLYHCGNIEKHNTFRLTAVAKKIHAVLQRSDPTATLIDAYLAMEDFQRWFHEDIFLYHLTKLSEMLNSIAWGIQDYLTPEYRRSYTVVSGKSERMHFESYRFECPAGITSELGRAFHWELMNQVRAKPYVMRFKTSRHLVGRY